MRQNWSQLQRRCSPMQVLIHRFPADAELPRQTSFLFPRSRVPHSFAPFADEWETHHTSLCTRDRTIFQLQRPLLTIDPDRPDLIVGVRAEATPLPLIGFGHQPALHAENRHGVSAQNQLSTNARAPKPGSPLRAVFARNGVVEGRN